MVLHGFQSRYADALERYVREGRKYTCFYKQGKAVLGKGVEQLYILTCGPDFHFSKVSSFRAASKSRPQARPSAPGTRFKI